MSRTKTLRATIARRKGRGYRILRENQERRTREAEEAYQRRYKWLAACQEEKRVLREEATAAAKIVLKKVLTQTWEAEQEAENR